MGNWRNRPRHRFHNQRREQGTSHGPYYGQRFNSRGFHEDGVPAWEKKFCRFIGSIPWWKVRSAKLSMSSHSNIFHWDDSAGEEAFQNAKKRFWADMNGLHCDCTLPDPDIYIDDIDWNPVIDPQLIDDLEREYVPLDAGEKEAHSNYEKRARKSDYVHSGQCSQKLGPDMVGLPLNNKSQYCRQLDGDDKHLLIDENNNENPWERDVYSPTEVSNGWGGYIGTSLNSNRLINLKNNGDTSCKSWGDGRADIPDWKEWGKCKLGGKNMEYGRSGEHWGDWNHGYTRRSDPHRYVSSCRNIRFKKLPNKSYLEY